jgi:hypothetical protein
MGLPVEYETNAQAVHKALFETPPAGRLDRSPEPAWALPGPVPRVRLLLAQDSAVPSRPLRFRTTSPHRLEIEGPGFHGHADARARVASCTLSSAVLDPTEKFHDHIVSTLTLFLVTRLDRQPFHAAALARAGKAVLLSGPSGAGKSTLAYTALRNGWTVLADDAVYLQSSPHARIWARPARIHLPPDAQGRFVELENLRPELRANGKTKLAIDAATPSALAPLERAALCLIERSTKGPEHHPLSVEQAITSVLQDLETGFDAFRNTIAPVLHALVAPVGAWRIRTGPDPVETLRLIGQLQD